MTRRGPLFRSAPLLAALCWAVPAAALSASALDRLSLSGAAGVTIGAVALPWMAIRWFVPLFRHRGRRRFVGRFGRITRWEFWPWWVFYIPIVLHILRLGIRHRCLTLFTACNPALPAAGFVGESKTDMLEALRSATDRMPPFHRAPAGPPPDDRAAAVKQFMAECRLTFPIVLKPDLGQRGEGVKIAHSSADIDRYFRGMQGDVIAQAYVQGSEFGILYYRHPDASRGVIFSIAEKVLPVVTGDGCRTLEDLILDDPRAVFMADVYLRRNARRRHETIPDGERVAIADLGNHCLGAIFMDGRRWNSPALAATLDRVARAIPGFHLGRFDVRAPSGDALTKGDFAIIELNGVTSEAAHIYDPGIGLREAYRTLMEQWRIAFEIGAAHRARGVCPLRVAELWRAVWAFKRAPEPPI